jgi:hypothetical protein
MKKLALIITLLVIQSYSSNAQQTDRSRVMAGGVFNMNYDGSQQKTIYSSAVTTTSALIKTYKLEMNPSIAVFLFKNFAMGIKVRGQINSTRQDTFSSRNASFNAGPFVRYYYKVGPFAPFAELSFGLGNISANASGFKSQSKGNIIGGGPGIAYFVSDRIGIEGLLNYEHLYSNVDVNAGGISSKSSKGNSIRFSVGLQIYL